MRVLVVMGSPNGLDGTTGQVVSEILESMRANAPLDVQAVETKDLDLGSSCPACLSCMTDGEQTCPNYDRMQPVVEQLADADLVVFASPIHSFHVSASMKRFFDHFAYLIHRPRFFGTPAVLVTTAAGAGHPAALDYMQETIRRWGLHTVSRLGVNGPGLKRPPYRARVDAAIAEVAREAVAAVTSGEEPSPSLNDLIAFRVAKLLVQSSAEPGDVDDAYWTERGWYDADWFTDRRVNPVKNRLAAGIESRIRRGIERGSAKPKR